VTEVYVDVAAAALGGGMPGAASSDEDPTAARVAMADPEAVRALRYLAEAGVRVVIVRPDALEPPDDLRAAAADVLPAVPDRPKAPAWYLTSDISRCRGSSAHLRTVLIGGAPPNGSVRRCDAVARDVQAAAMEILAADAMAPPSTLSS
jgi:hypothetical protein